MSAEEAEAIIQSNQETSNKGGLDAKKIHIRVQNRGTRKYVTTVQGIDQRANFNKILKHWKAEWGVSGTVEMFTTQSGAQEKIIQMQGNVADKVREFLITEEFTEEENIIMHGLNA